MRRNGRTEIRMEKEIREKVHVSGRARTVRGLKRQKAKKSTIFSSRFISCVVRQTFFFFFLHMYRTFERTWSLWDDSLLYCDYMAGNFAKMFHFWVQGLGICK